MTKGEATKRQVETQVDTAIAILDKRKAQDIVKIPIPARSSLADYFIVCHGSSRPHAKALADELEFQLEEQLGLSPIAIEGAEERQWILMDYGDFIVHIFTRTTREYYALEKLWMSQEDLQAYRARPGHED